MILKYRYLDHYFHNLKIKINKILLSKNIIKIYKNKINKKNKLFQIKKIININKNKKSNINGFHNMIQSVKIKIFNKNLMFFWKIIKTLKN